MEELSRLTTLPSAAAVEAIAEAAFHEATHTDDGPAEMASVPDLPHMEVSHYTPHGGESLRSAWR